MAKPAISILGMGYVGLATALCFSGAGYKVKGVDVDEEKVRAIAAGKSPIHEAKIDSLLASSLARGRFSISSDVEEAISKTAITFITVGTPSEPDGDIDLRFVRSAASSVGASLAGKRDYHLVVVKSTVVPTTTALTVKPLIEAASDKKAYVDFGLCFNPEFLREGTAVEDTLNPDALIIGSEDKLSSKKLLQLYKQFYHGKLPFTLITSTSNAEFVKYSVNAFRATQLSFLNSLANLCERTPGADVSEVTKGLSAATKIDNRYLKSGLGFGGSCLPKDLRALIATFRKTGMEPELLVSALSVNEIQHKKAIELARDVLGEIEGRKISILGLSFKAGTDDIRESVAISLAKSLISYGALVCVYDPKAMINAQRILHSSVEYSRSAVESLEGADCCIIATGWEEFKRISPIEFRQRMHNPLIIDGCRLFDSERFQPDTGVALYQLGRNQDRPKPQTPLKVLSVKNYS